MVGAASIAVDVRGVSVVLLLLFSSYDGSLVGQSFARRGWFTYHFSEATNHLLVFFTPLLIVLYRVSGGLLIGALYASLRTNTTLGLFLTFRKCNKSRHQNELVRFVNAPV